MISACTCFNCETESPEAPSTTVAEAAAGAAGWVIGLDPDGEDADAVYACGQCAPLLVSAHAVRPINTGQE